jgi:hypothetical protein
VSTLEISVAGTWPSCKACVFCEDGYECHRDAPAVITDPVTKEALDNDSGQYSFAEWSPVSGEAWCGRFVDYATGRTFLEAVALFREAHSAVATQPRL